MTDGPELLRIGVGGVVPVQWSVEKSDDPGTLTGWASVYNVVDQQDDIVVPGALRKSITEWRASNRVIPLTLDHQNTAEGVIGSLSKAEDTAYGLKTTFRFSSTQKAQDARTKAREGHLNGLSIWGPIFDKAFDTVAGKSVRLLKEIGLAFVGLTPMPANTGSLVVTAKAASNTPWSQFSQADYSDEQWARACLIDTGQGEGKQRFKLPVKEPSGVVNRNGAHAAAGRLNQVQASADQKAAAARKLVAIYRGDLGEDPPDSLLRLAGMMAASLDFDEFTDAMRGALTITHPAAMKAAVDVLLGSYRVEPTEISDRKQVEDDDVAKDASDEEAAAYALSFANIGESGPGEGPPGGEPIESLADELLASVGAEQSRKDIQVLAAELKSAQEAL